MTKRTGNIFENIVIVMIILVLIQTFIEDFAVISGWTWSSRSILIITGFVFDLFFTIEFLTRSYLAISKKRFSRYFFAERGWIDALASIPLIMLNSGPNLIALMAVAGGVSGMGGFLNVLKVVKAVRIARILRLLRLLKIFKQIKHTDSVMAQRHVAKITTLCITVFVFALFISNLASGSLGITTPDSLIRQRHERVSTMIISQDLGRLEKSAFLSSVKDQNSDVLLIKKDGKTVYTRMENYEYREDFGFNDYSVISLAGYDVFWDNRPILKVNARESLTSFIVIILLVVVFLVYYSPHFALTVTDPIHVMRRGFSDHSYNLEVKVNPDFADDDIYQLAKLYNEEFLPLKERSSHVGGEKGSSLKLDDFKDLLGGM